ARRPPRCPRRARRRAGVPRWPRRRAGRRPGSGGVPSPPGSLARELRPDSPDRSRRRHVRGSRDRRPRSRGTRCAWVRSLAGESAARVRRRGTPVPAERSRSPSPPIAARPSARRKLSSSRMGEVAIELSGLSKSFGSRTVLDGIDLTVERGTILGYIGPNGAGKSTTVKILCGLLPDFEGEVRVLGLDPRADALAVKRRIGYVPE